MSVLVLATVVIYTWVCALSASWEARTEVIYGTAGSKLGASVAMSGDGSRLVVGAPTSDAEYSDGGKMAVYEWDSDWTEQGNITSCDGGASGQFGTAVAINYYGTVAAASGIFNGGFVCVYQYNATDASWSARGSALSNSSTSLFGVAVAFDRSGDILAVGASGSRSLLIYDFSGSDWALRMVISEAGGLFGSSAALSSNGDVLAVGDPFQSSGALVQHGSVYIYRISGSAVTLRTCVNATTTTAYFGTALGLNGAGSVLAVGAPADDGLYGRVEVYRWSAGTQTWFSCGLDEASSVASDAFGFSVALSADGATLAAAAGAGAYVKVYALTASTCSADPMQTLTVADAVGSSRMLALSATGGVLALGRQLEATAGSMAGAVSVYDRLGAPTPQPTSQPSSLAYATTQSAFSWVQMDMLVGTAMGDQFGVGLALNDAGDRLVVGSPQSNSDDGSAVVYGVSDDDGSWVELATLTGQAGSTARCGYGVATNGDGSIVAVGCPYQALNADLDNGRVSVYQVSGSELADYHVAVNYSTPGSVWGAVVAMSADGLRFAAAAPSQDADVFDDGGAVAVYSYDAGAWQQTGGLLTIKAPMAQYTDGYLLRCQMVAMSDDGAVVAISGALANATDIDAAGVVYVYRLVADDWQQLGQRIAGTVHDAAVGSALALSGSGEVLAVAAADGSVTVYGYDAADGWKTRGSPAAPATAGVWGYSMALNYAGDMVAVGFVSTDGLGDAVYVFAYDEAVQLWQPVGDPLTGSVSGAFGARTLLQQGAALDDGSAASEFGFALSASQDGGRVAVGAPYANDDEGAVFVFDYAAGNWSQVHAALSSSTTGALFGYAVALSATGDAVAVGAPGYSDGCGAVMVFASDGDDWVVTRTTLMGAAGDRLGSFVALANGATNLLVLSVGDTSGGTGRGSLAWYEGDVSSWVSASQLSGGDYGLPEAFTSWNRSQTTVALSADGSRLLMGFPDSDVDAMGSVVFRHRTASAFGSHQRFDFTVAGGRVGRVVQLDAAGAFAAMSCHRCHAVGAESYDAVTLMDRRTAAMWTTSDWLTPDAAADDFGTALAFGGFGGRVLAVGARRASDGVAFVRLFAYAAATGWRSAADDDL
eukprot:gene16913-12104_t